MKKISIKIGLLFFCLIFAMEVCLFYLLYQKIAQTRIDEQLSALVTRGNNHRDVLETYYNQETIEHIALMEAKSDTEVVITDRKGEVVISSIRIDGQIQHLLRKAEKSIPEKGKVIEADWQSGSYIATISPYKAGVHKGYVYMFQHTGQLQRLIQQLNRHFMIAGISTVLITAIIILILSKIIAAPLVKMKEATKELGSGNFSIQFKTKSKDELGELAQSIQLLSDELNHLKTERNEFLASIAHELRTPLTYIKGYAEVAKRDNLQAEERLSYLNIITEETTKLTNLVGNLMELARLDNNAFTIQTESFSVCDRLEAISKKLLPAFKQERKNLVIHCPGTVQIKADPVRFEQIIFNLTENARKYSSEGATTTIEVTKIESEIEISIRDEGKGIPEKEIPFLFERFYRVDKSRSRELGGTGLGLSIVKELVDAHRWKMTVSSQIGKGTTFTILVRGDM